MVVLHTEKLAKGNPTIQEVIDALLRNPQIARGRRNEKLAKRTVFARGDGGGYDEDEVEQAEENRCAMAEAAIEHNIKFYRELRNLVTSMSSVLNTGEDVDSAASSLEELIGYRRQVIKDLVAKTMAEMGVTLPARVRG